MHGLFELKSIRTELEKICICNRDLTLPEAEHLGYTVRHSELVPDRSRTHPQVECFRSYTGRLLD